MQAQASKCRDLQLQTELGSYHGHMQKSHASVLEPSTPKTLAASAIWLKYLNPKPLNSKAYTR